ncbi:hypothetical protein PYX06_11750 [Citrobacter amalonaticus]|nr:hypothetical protein [Citrobacter amalonaticus]
MANINSSSSPLFKSSDQIGYYLYGNGATANIGKADMNDNGQARTTLFRIANGANFAGNTINPANKESSSLKMTLTGEQSIGVFATGKGSIVDTGEATFTVSGKGGYRPAARRGRNRDHQRKDAYRPDRIKHHRRDCRWSGAPVER